MNSQAQFEIAPRSFDLIFLMHMFSYINLINVFFFCKDIGDYCLEDASLFVSFDIPWEEQNHG